MLNKEVEVGGIYVAKISGRLTRVRITGTRRYAVGRKQWRDGWTARNLRTNRQVFIRSGRKLRRRITPPYPRDWEKLTTY